MTWTSKEAPPWRGHSYRLQVIIYREQLSRRFERTTMSVQELKRDKERRVLPMNQTLIFPFEKAGRPREVFLLAHKSPTLPIIAVE
jgi:hypothetical protein